MNPTSSGSSSKPHFHNINKPYMTPFQKHKEILRENTKIH